MAYPLNHAAMFVPTIRGNCARLGDAAAFHFLPQGEVDGSVETLGFGALDARARALAARLVEDGARGQRALLLFAPGLDFIAAFLGCLYAGVVAVPAYPPDPQQYERTLPRVRAIARGSGASIVLTTSDIAGFAEAMADVAPELTTARWISVDALSPELAERFAPLAHADGDVAFLQYTSGSTATPRGVKVTHGNLLHNSQSIRRVGAVSERSVAVNWLPSYHDMGLIGAILQPLFSGFSAVLLPPYAFLRRPARWLEAITRYRGTASAFPNFALDLCVRKVTDEELARLDLSTWSAAWNGAEPVRAASLDRFAERFARCGFRREAFVPVYGLAESTLIVSGARREGEIVTRAVSKRGLTQHAVRAVSPDDDDVATLVGCGRPVDGTEVIAVEPAGCRRAAPGEVGELWVRGPSVAAGYWEDDARSRATFEARLADTGEGPFLRTGDLGFVDDGQVFVTGRSKDLIVVRGANYYPQDLELAVERAHPAVRPGSVAALSLEGPRGEGLAVVVEVREGGAEDLDALVLRVREAVFHAASLAVDAVALVPPGSIPKTSSGKIQRHACREALANASLPTIRLDAAAPPPASPPAAPNDPTREGVLDALARVTGHPREAFATETRLITLGMDSLRVTELSVELERRFGPVRDNLFGDALMTFGDLLREFQGRAPRVEGALPDDAPAAAPSRQERISDFDEVREVRAALERFTQLGVGNPYGRDLQGLARESAAAGRELVNFATFDYLGLSGDPRVVGAAARALAAHGTSASASRVAWGDREAHRALELDLASFLGCEGALVSASGHATNVAAISTLVGPDDLVLHDSLAHDSLVTGARLSGARRITFPHNDLDALEVALRGARSSARRALIVVEGAYSMDGDLAPLRELVAIKRRHGALLYVDEAHSIGTVGATGRGLGELAGVARDDVDVWMGTLSKALASCGGYVAGSRALIELLRYRCGGFVFATAIAPAAAAAAGEALRVLRAEPERVIALQRNASRFVALCRARGVDTGRSAGTPIVPAIVGDSARCLRVSESLRRRGINAPPIFHPAVEERLARLRFFVSARHTEAQLEAAANALAEELSVAARAPRSAAPSLAAAGGEL